MTFASQGNTTAQSQDNEIKKPSTTSPSISSFSDQLLLTDNNSKTNIKNLINNHQHQGIVTKKIDISFAKSL